MAERFVEVDRNTPMLLPADLRDWVPKRLRSFWPKRSEPIAKGKSIRGGCPKKSLSVKPPVASGPDPKAQSNLSDPDSRIMRKSKNQAFAQAYNPQLAVDADGSQLILGAYVSQSSADNNELQPMSNPWLELLKEFLVLSSSLYVGCKK